MFIYLNVSKSEIFPTTVRAMGSLLICSQDAVTGTMSVFEMNRPHWEKDDKSFSMKMEIASMKKEWKPAKLSLSMEE